MTPSSPWFPIGRRATLFARPTAGDPETWSFNIVLHGSEETVCVKENLMFTRLFESLATTEELSRVFADDSMLQVDARFRSRAGASRSPVWRNSCQCGYENQRIRAGARIRQKRTDASFSQGRNAGGIRAFGC